MKKIAIHSVPRSGSTWLGNIFNSHPDVNFNYQPLFSYAFKGYLDEMSSKQRIDSFFAEIAASDDRFINQADGIEKGIIPNFEKSQHPTHVCYKEVRYNNIVENLLVQDNDIKVIGLVRSPMATLYSWLNAPKEFRPDKGWKVEEEWQFAQKKNLGAAEEFNGYEKWKEVALLFEDLAQRFPDRFYLLSYDDLLHNTEDEIKKLFAFSGLDYPMQTMNFIKESKDTQQSDAYSVFKSKKQDDEWVGKLPDFILNHIENDLKNTELSKYL